MNQGPKGDCLIKKTEGRKSPDTVPLKATTKKNHIHYINRYLSSAPHYRRRWQAADLCKKPVAGRRPLEKTSLRVFTCLSCGGAARRRKIGGLSGAYRIQLL
jgi:hypothetical protein